VASASASTKNDRPIQRSATLREEMRMSRHQGHGFGFRLTLRRSIILILYVLLLFRVIIPLLVSVGQMKLGGLLLATLALSPPLLALLVAFLERPGPVKNWALSLLLCLFFPMLVLNHDLTVVHDYLVSGKQPTLWATLLINIVILTNTLPYAGRMVPRPCPNCRRRTLVPLLRLLKKDKRTANTCWCASCGGKFWKDRQGVWRVERRTTWLDASREQPAGQNGRPEAPGTPHCPQEGRAEINVHK
jgi:hypothetical protein